MSHRRVEPITQLSAALTIVQWAQEHGREPRCGDCCGSGGLLWYTTYYKCFKISAFSSIVSLAFTIAQTEAEPPPPPHRRMKPCLNAPACSEMIPDEGRHIRLCGTCRRMQQRTTVGIERDYLEPCFSRTRLAQFGLGGDGFDDELEGV